VIDTLLPAPNNPDWAQPQWAALLDLLAAKIVAITNPATSLDVGCGRGAFVAALASKGVEAYGITDSGEDVDSAVADSVAVGPIPPDRRWDLITCLQSLDAMPATEAESAISAICASTDRALVCTVASGARARKPPPAWAAEFAERGFYRRLDVDLSFFSSTTALFERAEPSKRDLAYKYEAFASDLQEQLLATRLALADNSTASDTQRERDMRHQLMISRDHAIGTEAELGTLRAENALLHNEIAHIRHELARHQDALRDIGDVRSSTTWRIGRAVIEPAARIRKIVRPG
jgi:hypothetical protein